MLDDIETRPQAAPTRVVLLHDAIADAEPIFAAYECVLPASVGFTNAGRIGLDRFERDMLHRTYRSRVAAFDPVLLGRLPQGITMLGGESHWLIFDDTLILDQINPLTPDRLETCEQLLAMSFTTEEITDPCVLVSRYGESTWGHWVGEILPRAILAEQAHPGKFRYVIAERIVTTGKERDYARAVLESLAAYGIAEDRILRIRPDRYYRFANLHAVSGIWSVTGMNPLVIERMRSLVLEQVKPAGHRRVALLRRGRQTRSIANADAVERLLKRAGFHCAMPERLSFLDQVALFLDCDMVLGVQGSGLFGLIYAKPEIRVITVAPSDWADTYFHPIIQARDGWHADLRGPTMWDGRGLERDASFLAIEHEIEAAIAHLDQPQSALAPGGLISLSGQVMPRRLGARRLAMQFRADADLAGELGQGWLIAEPNHTWSSGPWSTLRIPLPRTDGDLVMELDVMALIAAPALTGRPLDVLVNGETVASVIIAGFETVSCRLPTSCLDNREWIDILFVHPLCIPPRLTGHGEDDRPTAIGFIALRVFDVDTAVTSAAKKEA